jgi:hypothetical protein
MTEADKLLVANLLEALRQIQSCLILGIGASFSALVLAIPRRRVVLELEPELTERKEKIEANPELANVSVPGVSVPLSPSIALLVLLMLTVVMGLVADYAAYSVIGIASQLRSFPKVLEAISTFPSIAIAHNLSLKFIPALAPALLASIAVCLQLARDRSTLIALGVWLLLIIVPYAYLAHLLRHPIPVPT